MSQGFVVDVVWVLKSEKDNEKLSTHAIAKPPQEFRTHTHTIEIAGD